MVKLKHPFSYYYKTIMEGVCPFCQSEYIKDSRNNEVIWCNGYEHGGYITKISCETYAGDSMRTDEEYCRYCAAGEFVSRHKPQNLVVICGDCDKAIDFGKQEVSDILF